MKKLFLFFILITSISSAHKQHVHQYLTVEAYNLLKIQLGFEIPKLQERLGGETGWYIGERPWQRRFLTTGAWREDEEDIIYGYSKSSPPTLTGVTGAIYEYIISAFGGLRPDGFVSSTHFWYADDGDNLSTTIRAAIDLDFLGIPLGIHAFNFTIPNAYQKFMKFAQPNRSWTLKYHDGKHRHESIFKKSSGSNIKIIWYDQIGFQYNSLKELYTTGRAWIVGYYNLRGQWVNSNLNPSLPYEVVLGKDWRDAFVWEILGRMCHLLQDMSVPAHANIDPHGDNPALIKDYYENYFGYDFYWNAQNVYSQIGGMINPYQYQPNNPLHFLMYTTNQMANHFATQGPHKKQNNDYFSGDFTQGELAYLNSLNVSQFGIPTSDNGPWNNDAIINVRNKMLPQAIRATAGLLY